MTFEIKDLVGLSKPLTKLVDVVSDGIGMLYRPKAMRAQADAHAYEVKTIARAAAEAEVEAHDIRFGAVANRIQLMFRDHPELAERARQRLLAREIEGQLNIEAIADCASDALPETVSEDTVGTDWRRKFFLEAENVCDVDMQQLWGKVLAGEVSKPGSFSLRTLETLKHLSREEAELFRKACAIAMSDGWIAILGLDLNTGLSQFGLTYSNILSLRDAGLVIYGDNLQKDFRQKPPQTEPTSLGLMLTNNGVQIQITCPSPGILQIPVLAFTEAGQQLVGLIAPNETPSYLKVLGDGLRQRGCVVKRGTTQALGEGTWVVTFDQDL